MSPNSSTQRVWLAAMRRFVRHLASEGLITDGREDTLPKRVDWKRSSLPRFFAQEEKEALGLLDEPRPGPPAKLATRTWNAC